MIEDDDDRTRNRQTKQERLDAVHQRAMRRFDAIWEAEREERLQSLFDRRFAAVRGAQWDGTNTPQDEDSEETGGPARFEIPKFLRPIRRVMGEFRSSRKTVDFKPKDDGDDASVDNLDGLYRADENDSIGGGQLAYDNGFSEGIHGGRGGWRVRARYEDESDEDNDHQRIGIEAIYDADQSLFFDINAKNPDKSDARHAFLLFTMTKDAFEEQHPDASPSTFTDLTGYPWQYEWTRPDTITLAEYYEIEDRSVVRRTFKQTVLEGIDGIEAPEVTHDDADLKADDGKLEDELRARGYRQVRKRRIRRQKVHKYLLNGMEVLDDEGFIAGPNIPLVPFYAERCYVDGIERVRGMVRPAIDATIINNLVVSNLAEDANGPTHKIPVFAPEQMDGGLGTAWATYKVDRPAYLLAKPIYDAEGNNIIAAGPTSWVEPNELQPATAALMQVMDTTIDALMGANAAAETVPANTSAAAIELVNDRGDVNDFLWHDNFQIALERTGTIWLGQAKELYVEEGRKMTAIDKNGGKSQITLAEPKQGDGGQYLANDLTRGMYDVLVDVGPATKTRKDATVKSCLNTAQVCATFATAGDQTALSIGSAMLGTAVLNMDGEGFEGPRSFIRKLGVSAGWIEPNEQEKLEIEAAKQAEGQQQDPNVLLAQAQMIAAQAEVTKAETGRLEAETKKITAQAQARKAEADAAAALAGIDRADRQQILAEVKAETDSDRADEKLDLDAARTETEFDMRERQAAQTGGTNGDAA